jgi:hypothetical protein
LSRSEDLEIRENALDMALKMIDKKILSGEDLKNDKKFLHR